MCFAISCRSPQSVRIKYNLLNNRCITFLNFCKQFLFKSYIADIQWLILYSARSPQSAGNRKTHRQSVLSLYAAKVRSKGASHVFMLRYASQNIGASHVFKLSCASQNIGASHVFKLRFASQNIGASHVNDLWFYWGWWWFCLRGYWVLGRSVVRFVYWLCMQL